MTDPDERGGADSAERTSGSTPPDADSGDDPLIDAEVNVTLTRRGALRGGATGLAATGIGGLLLRGGTRPAVAAAGDWAVADLQVGEFDEVEKLLVGNDGTLTLQWEGFEPNQVRGVDFTLEAKLAQQGTNAGSENYETVASSDHHLGHHAEISTSDGGQGQKSFSFLSGPSRKTTTASSEREFTFTSPVNALDASSGYVYYGLDDGSVNYRFRKHQDPFQYHSHHDSVTGISESDRVVYSSGTGTYHLVAHDADGNDTLWRNSFPGLDADAVHGSSDAVYFGGEDSNGGLVRAVDPADGSTIWTHREHSGGVTGVHADAGVVYSVGGGDVVAYDSQTRAVLWRDSQAPNDVYAYDGTVYVCGDVGSVMTAYDSADGTTLWTKSANREAYAVHASAGVVYTGGASPDVGWLWALDTSDGELLWSHSEHVGWPNDIATTWGYVYSGGDDNKLVSYYPEVRDQTDAFVAQSVANSGTIDIRNVDVIANHSAIVPDDFNPTDGAESPKETTVDLRLTLSFKEYPGDADASPLDVDGTEQTASFTVTNQPNTGDGSTTISGTVGADWT